MTTKVVNVRDHSHDVYIGRGSMWGNPFVIGKDGTRDEVIEKYRWFMMQNKHRLNHLHLLQGKTLGCHCKPLRCHGDILVWLCNIESMFNGEGNNG